MFIKKARNLGQRWCLDSSCCFFPSIVVPVIGVPLCLCVYLSSFCKAKQHLWVCTLAYACFVMRVQWARMVGHTVILCIFSAHCWLHMCHILCECVFRRQVSWDHVFAYGHLTKVICHCTLRSALCGQTGYSWMYRSFLFTSCLLHIHLCTQGDWSNQLREKEGYS